MNKDDEVPEGCMRVEIDGVPGFRRVARFGIASDPYGFGFRPPKPMELQVAHPQTYDDEIVARTITGEVFIFKGPSR